MIHAAATPQHKELGPYQIDLLLGKGGMGEVYKAFDDRLGRWVAVKRMAGDATASARERFRREARILAQLGHPAIVQIFDIVEEDAKVWIVMELVDGPTLAELRHGGPLDVGLALDYARQIASALESAHGSGIVHRDLKTENVMVLPSGHVKVLDFGLAHRVASGVSDATRQERDAPTNVKLSRTGRVLGTPRAMSPEQARGREVDARSDLFSFGVLLYEILTVRSPFMARTVDETLQRVITHAPPSARRLNPKIPRELSELINRLLEKDPAHRCQTAAGVEAELAFIGGGGAVHQVASHDPPTMETLDSSSIETLGEVGTSNDALQDDVVVTTLLVSDLVGSTQLVEELGDRDAAALFQRHDRLARDLLEEHGGREIDKTDGFLMLFDLPWNAVSYALAYHEGLRDLALDARVAIHLGEVILYRNTSRDVERGAKPVEVEGLAKPTVARLMSLATGAQTLLTRAAYDVARRSAASVGDRDWQWLAHGHYRFQGLGDDIEVFEVGVPGTAPLVAPTGSDKAWRAVELPPSDHLPTAQTAHQVVTLRSWPPPKVPDQPYPVLLPYTHPDFLAGRDQEIARLRRLLEMPVPVLGLSAPSGTGKSSLLLGGLVPTLRTGKTPVALVRHPAETGVAARLIGDLLEGAEPVEEGDAAGFVERLAEVERLSGRAPVLVLDQFENVLREDAAEARCVLGVLMAASVVRRPGLTAPPCRWLIAYRREFHGQLQAWLGDVLAQARTSGVTGIEVLPHDMSQPERFHDMPLRPLAAPAPGTEDALGEAAQCFRAAIEKPLQGIGMAERWPWHFPPGHAERLADAFAAARIARPAAPLAPELQVVLAHLLAEAGPNGRVAVPDDPGSLIDRALDDHLRRTLEAVFPTDLVTSSTRRARALLALRELATSTGRRDEGLRPEELGRAIGDDGEAILDKLATPLTRLVVVWQAPDGPRWVLAHDRMAEAVVRLVEEEGTQGRLVVDTELLALRRFVTLRTALYGSRATRTSTRVSRRAFQRIEENTAALLWDDERRSWFTACRARRHSDRRRFAGLATVAVLVVALLGWGIWSSARQRAERRALFEQVVQGEPETAFRTFGHLAARPDADPVKLLALLRRRVVAMDVLEQGLGGLEGPERSVAVLRATEIALPWVEETPADPVLLTSLLWALDFTSAQDPPFAQQARELRGRVLEPLRRLQPPPPFPAPEDPDWIDVPAGSFLMGTGPGEEGAEIERPQHEVTVSAFRMQRHEVTNAEYRRLVPEHDPSTEDDLPAGFVDWYAAYTYAAWLGGRLPTEAEWEYAARAGCPYAYCTQDGLETTMDAVAWNVQNSLDVTAGELAPQPVMRLKPNPWGLYDMLGNLWEWTADGYGKYLDRPQVDPWRQPHIAHGARTDRGGYFGGGPGWVRVAARAPGAPGDVDWKQGLRVVLPGSPFVRK